LNRRDNGLRIDAEVALFGGDVIRDRHRAMTADAAT
jgi:hypothetical protein